MGLKVYSWQGSTYQFEEGKQPGGAVEVKGAPEKPANKKAGKPANKKAGKPASKGEAANEGDKRRGNTKGGTA